MVVPRRQRTVAKRRGRMMIALGRADSRQCAPKDQNYAGREMARALVVMSETPFQRHSLSMSPKAYVSFFRLCVVSLCVSSPSFWSCLWPNHIEPFSQLLREGETLGRINKMARLALAEFLSTREILIKSFMTFYHLDSKYSLDSWYLVGNKNQSKEHIASFTS